jgi:DNA-binding transcriptional MocR family regulator
MSFEAMAWAVKQDLPVKQKITLLMLANRINSDTGRCFPSVKGLAADCGMSETSVKEALRSLKDAGLIVAHERRVDGVSLSNEYEMPIDEIPPPRRVTPHPPAQYAPPPRRNTPPNLSLEPITEPSDVREDQFSLLSEEATEAKSDRFEDFWKVYPRKTAKEAARKAWPKAARKADPTRIIAAAQRYALKRAGEDERYTAHPATWLNAGSYDDADLQPPSPSAAPVQRWYAGGLVR